MIHRVVKPFPYSEDGFTLIDLAIGDERDFGSMADGLVAEGWIEAVVDLEKSIASPADEPKVESGTIQQRPRRQR